MGEGLCFCVNAGVVMTEGRIQRGVERRERREVMVGLVHMAWLLIGIYIS